MKKMIAGFVALAGIAAGAQAQTATLDLKVWNGESWVNSVDVLPGATVQAAMFIGFTDAYGFGGAVYNIQGNNLAAGDSVSITGGDNGRQAGFNFGAATQQVYTSGSSFRIDAANDAGNSVNAGIASTQRDPVSAGPAFKTDNPALVYRFTITLGADGSVRTINLSSPLDQLKGGVVGLYATANSTRPTNTQNVSIDGAAINVIPTPATLALVGLGGLVAGRRRSR